MHGLWFALQKSYYCIRFSFVVTRWQALKNFLCFVPQLIQKRRCIFVENRVSSQNILYRSWNIRKILLYLLHFLFQLPSSSISFAKKAWAYNVFRSQEQHKVCDRNISSKCVPCVTLNTNTIIQCSTTPFIWIRLYIKQTQAKINTKETRWESRNGESRGIKLDPEKNILEKQWSKRKTANIKDHCTV